jgi:hypothetical protein
LDGDESGPRIRSPELVRRFEGLLDPDLRPPLRERGMWLVRPDGYAACSGSDPGVIANYLDGIVRSGMPQRA